MDKLGIVFSSRVRSAALTVLALWILMVLGTGTAQVMSSYLLGAGFDVTVTEFLWVTMCVFFPYFLVAAIVLRSLAARLALYHKLRRQIVVPEYSPPEVLTPAEAGLLVDNDFTFNEVSGTLKDLELRGVIAITGHGHELEIRPVAGQNHELNAAEELFLRELFWPNQVFRTSDAGSRAKLLTAGKHMSSMVREQLVRDGLLPRNRRTNEVIRGVFAFFAVIALFIQLFLTIGVFSVARQIFSVNYPRYPMHVIEPALQLAMVALVVGIVWSGFWQRSLADGHGLKNWRYVAGLKMFIEKVHKDRFYRDGKQMASDGDMHTFYPYALALGIEKRFTEKLKRALVL